MLICKVKKKYVNKVLLKMLTLFMMITDKYLLKSTLQCCNINYIVIITNYEAKNSVKHFNNLKTFNVYNI